VPACHRLDAGSVLLPRIEIGGRAIVGAGSVVTRDVPRGAVVAGAPAPLLRYRPGFGPAIAPSPQELTACPGNELPPADPLTGVRRGKGPPDVPGRQGATRTVPCDVKAG
jgi:hypothetical protein